MAWLVYNVRTKSYVRSARLARPPWRRSYPIFTWIDDAAHAKPFPSEADASRWAKLVRDNLGGITEVPPRNQKG